MPGIEVEEGHEEVEADGGENGDNEVGEDVVAERDLFIVVEFAVDDVDSAEGVVGHDYSVDNHR